MEVIINHLTRMKAGYMCTAGVNPQTKQHIRLAPFSKRLETGMLAKAGGIFDIGNRIFFEDITPCPRKPHVEDHIFDPEFASVTGTMQDKHFWELLYSVSQTKLRYIFGDELQMIGRQSCGTLEGKGVASLGCLIPRQKPFLYFQPKRGRKTPQIRMKVSEGEFDVDLRVTDMRLYKDDHITPARETVDRVARKLYSSTRVILSVGLGRAFAPSGRSKRFHYLQVNNIHLKDNPVWQLA